MRLSTRLLTCLLFLLLTSWIAIAQSETSTVPALPVSARLDGLTLFHQDTNRCSAAALSIQLSYFETFTGTYNQVTQRLNPYGGDVSVRIEEMATVAREYGLGAVVRRGGTLELLKRLVANGFPVLIENVYYDGADRNRDWMSHNRVLIGYDDTIQTFYFYDPLLGGGEDGLGRPMTYDDVDTRWQPFNRDYLVVYREQDQALVQQILGLQWDALYNAEWTRRMAQSEIDSSANNAFAWFNRGWAELQLGMYSEAAISFDEARRLRLPWRTLWYEFGPFEAYLAVGRYDDVINLGASVLRDTDGVEEIYYYMARAYEGKGETDRAIANLNAALFRNRHYVEAQLALQRLQG